MGEIVGVGIRGVNRGMLVFGWLWRVVPARIAATGEKQILRCAQDDNSKSECNVLAAWAGGDYFLVVGLVEGDDAGGAELVLCGFAGGGGHSFETGGIGEEG